MFFNYRMRFISNSGTATLQGSDELCIVISAMRVCRLPPLFDMFLDTLCSKKSYDMPHIGCGIHALWFCDFPHW